MPAQAVRTRVREKRQQNVRTSPGPDGHVHCALIDERGIGLTDRGPDGHQHRVRGLDVSAAGGHTHEIAGRCTRTHSRSGLTHAGEPQ